MAAGFDRGLRAPGDETLIAGVRKLMWEKVGLARDEAGLTAAAAELERLARQHPGAAGEVRNLLGVARLVTAAALARRESRGGHYRSDFPRTDPDWQRRLFLTAAADGSAVFEREETVASLAWAGAGSR